MAHNNDKMTHLPSHEFFENLLLQNAKNRPANEPYKPLVVVKFGAEWCGPCKKLDMDKIVNTCDAAEWYCADADEDETTMLYAGVQTIPAFMAIVHGKPKPIFQSSNTDQVIAWVNGIADTIRGN